MTKNKFYLFILSLLFLINNIYATVDLTQYEYVSTIKVNCDEYIGYARFELPKEYLNLNTPKSYLDTEYFIDKNNALTYYINLENWYVKTITGYNLSNTDNIYNNDYKTNLENMYDKNFNTAFVVQGVNTISFNFENPSVVTIKKISIDLKDSKIDSLKIFDNNGKQINFILNQDKFHYEIIFSEPINSNFLKFNLEFKDVLKIREINFYQEIKNDPKSFVYFYINNQCNKEYKFYFGSFGESNVNYGSQILPIEFETKVSTINNLLYNNDFDNDTILNNIDNCLFTKNADQKDINYNKIGDACEDFDSDGILNNVDNCPKNYNPDQLDNDKDGIGNVCDTNDGRFFEKNNYLIYIMAGLIALVFLAISIYVMRKK